MSRYGYTPQDKPLFEGVDMKSLPEVLQVDGRTVDGIKAQIKEVKDQQVKLLRREREAATRKKREEAGEKLPEEIKIPPKPLRTSILGMPIKAQAQEEYEEEMIIPLNLNEAQKKFILEYVRYCVEKKIENISGTLSAAAYNILSGKSEDMRKSMTMDHVFEKLSRSPDILTLASVLARAPHDVDSSMDERVTHESKKAEMKMKESYMLKSQQALALSNYDEAVLHAQTAAKEEIPDNVLHAMLCLLIRAAKQVASFEEKIEDLDACLEYSLQFRTLAKTNIAFEEQMGKMTNLMKRAAEGRVQLIKAIEQRKSGGGGKKK